MLKMSPMVTVSLVAAALTAAMADSNDAFAAVTKDTSITDEEVISHCANEMIARDQDFLRQRKSQFPHFIEMLNFHRSRGNLGEAAKYQQNISDSEADIADLNARGFQSTRGWLHWGGQSVVSFINNLRPAELRLYFSEARSSVSAGTVSFLPRFCAYGLRIAKLDGRPPPQVAQLRAIPQAAPVLQTAPVTLGLNGEWLGQTSRNRGRLEVRQDGLYMSAVTQNAGQSNQPTIFHMSSDGTYRYQFPDGQSSTIKLLGPNQIRVTNPDGWTDVFNRVGP